MNDKVLRRGRVLRGQKSSTPRAEVALTLLVELIEPSIRVSTQEPRITIIIMFK